MMTLIAKYENNVNTRKSTIVYFKSSGITDQTRTYLLTSSEAWKKLPTDQINRTMSTNIGLTVRRTNFYHNECIRSTCIVSPICVSIKTNLFIVIWRSFCVLRLRLKILVLEKFWKLRLTLRLSQFMVKFVKNCVKIVQSFSVFTWGGCESKKRVVLSSAVASFLDIFINNKCA